MVLTAWPEVDDQRDGALFAGPAGPLLDAMLRAIGMTRGDCYLASLAVTRPPGGRCDDRDRGELDRLLWHHLGRSEEHTSELQSLMRISYAVFCLKKKTKHKHTTHSITTTNTHCKSHCYNTSKI